MDKTIGLRAGHIGATKSTGASANGLNERDINQKVYEYVYKRLSTYGFKIINKTGELGSTVYNHYNKYLPTNDYLLLCIHHDGQTDVNITGSMVLASVFASSKSLSYARALLNEFCKAFDSKNRGIYQRKNDAGKDYYGIIRETKPSVILGEALVLTNKNDANYIKNNYDYFITAQGEAYVKIACSWYGVNYTSVIVGENEINTNYDKRFESLETEINTLKTQVENIQKPEKYDKVLKLIDWIESYENTK